MKAMIWTLKLPLDPNDYALRQLRSRFEIGRLIYNSILAEAKRRAEVYMEHPGKKLADKNYKEYAPQMAKIKVLGDKDKKTKDEKQELRELKAEAKAQKEFRQEHYNAAVKESGFYFKSAAKNHGLNNSIGQWAARLQYSWFNEHTDSTIVYGLAERAFNAVNKMVKGTGRTNKYGGKEKAKKVRFVPRKPMRHNLTCMDSTSNRKGIRYRDGQLVWKPKNGKPLNIPIKFNERDLMVQHFYSFYGPFEEQVAARKAAYGDVADPIRQIAIVRKWVRGGWRYWAHICVNAPPLIKPNQMLGKGQVGINVYSDRIGFFTEEQAGTIRFDSLATYQPVIRVKQRQTSRMQREHNPDNFEDDFKDKDGHWKKGKVKPRPKLTFPWRVSGNQQAVYNVISELQRCKASNRRDKHGEIAHVIRALGDRVVVYKRNIKFWQQTKGLSQRVTKYAPATFLILLKQRFEATGGEVHEIEGKLTFWDNWPECLKEFTKDVATAYSAYCVEIGEGGEQKLNMKRLERLAATHKYRTLLNGTTEISV